MSSTGRPVPWASWQEWLQVAAWLDSPDTSAVQKGIDRVAAWRCRGRVPLAADIHACLAEIRLRDPCTGGQSAAIPGVSTSENDALLRMHYSMAIVRLVNGIADSAQKGRTAVSVASLAATAGLPRMLVDLRHEATHNELPSLPLLRVAAQHALAWLRSSYWQAQTEQLRHCVSRCRQLLQDLLRSVPGLVHDVTASRPQQASWQRQQRAVLQELKALVPSAAAALLVEPLLEPGFVRLPATLAAAAQQAASIANADSTADDAAARAEQEAAEAEQYAVQLAAWQSGLASLAQEWPALPGLLLAAAIAQGLEVECPATAAAARPCALSWATLLLQNAEPPAVTGGGTSGSTGGSAATSRGRPQQPTFAWQPSRTQLGQLLMDCLGATQWAATGTAGGVLDVALLLADLLAGSQSSADLLPTLQDAEDTQLQVIAKASEVGKRQFVLNGETPSTSRWQRVQSWMSCAIGGTPSPHDPNGPFEAMSLPAAEDVVRASAVHAETVPATGEEEWRAEAVQNYFARFHTSALPDDPAQYATQTHPPAVGVAPSTIAVW